MAHLLKPLLAFRPLRREMSLALLWAGTRSESCWVWHAVRDFGARRLENAKVCLRTCGCKDFVRWLEDCAGR